MTPAWMWKFLKLVLRDTFNFYPQVLRYISGIKTVKLIVLTFFTSQLFYFLNKFFIYFDFNFSIKEIASLLSLIFIFPFLFAYEKFWSGSFFGTLYSPDNSEDLWSSTKEKFGFYGSPKRAWLVYFLSQASSIIDVVIFASIFTTVLFLKSLNLFLLESWLFLLGFLVVAVLLFIISVFLWNRSFQVFRFWDKNENIWQALTESHEFTTKHPRRFITLHSLIKFSQFVVPTVLGLLVYKYSGNILDILSKIFTQNSSVYMVMILLGVVAFFAYQFLVAFANVYGFRLAHYFEIGQLDKNYEVNVLRKRQDFRLLRKINLLVILITFLSLVIFIHFQVTSARAVTKKVEVKFPNIIKLYSDGINSTTTINSYLTPRYANGIAMTLVEDDGQLYAQPLVAQLNSPLVPNSISVAGITFFNLSQTFVPSQIKIPLQDAIEFSNARKFTLFLYIPTKEVASLLATSTEKMFMQSKFTSLIGSDLDLSSNLQKDFHSYRVGSLVKIIDLSDYPFKQILLFNKDVSNKSLTDLKNRNINVYLLLQAGERPDPALDLSLVQGIFTDLPELSYNEVRTISEEDVLKTVILSPLKIFGF